MDELCRTHPKLQYLHLNDNNGYSFDIKNDWMLNNLKTFVYNCGFPRKGNISFSINNDSFCCILVVYYIFSDILETFLKATPNLEALHIGYSNRSAIDPWAPTGYKPTTPSTDADCLKMIGLRCDRLTTLSLNAFYLFKGDFFETVSTRDASNIKFNFNINLFEFSILDIQWLPAT